MEKYDVFSNSLQTSETKRKCVVGYVEMQFSEVPS